MIVWDGQFQFFDGVNHITQCQLKSRTKYFVYWRILLDANDGRSKLFTTREILKEL